MDHHMAKHTKFSEYWTIIHMILKPTLMLHFIVTKNKKKKLSFH